MANAEHVKLLRQGVPAWNKWRQKHSGEVPDLHSADLTAVDLRGADLHATKLAYAKLAYADLTYADLTYADLAYADIHKAILAETVFADVNLTDVRGLEDCYHLGPSIIDIRTLGYGPLPLTFLRGCGLPETMIKYLPSLFNAPLQFYSCFISYSSKDEKFAQRLHADLQNKGVRCWFAPHDMQGGKKIHEQIDQAIRVHEKVLLILSEHSMQSEWVKTEIANARQREIKDKQQVLFPLRLVDYETIRDWKCFDADTGKDSAREIREYFIPDFSQ